MRRNFYHSFLSLLGFLMLYGGSVSAALVSYTNEADFLAAIAPLPIQQTVDFESLSAGEVIPSGTTVDGITFNYSIDGLQMNIGDTFDTTSPNNYLGLDDGGDGVFLSGDSFTMEPIAPPVGKYTPAMLPVAIVLYSCLLQPENRKRRQKKRIETVSIRFITDLMMIRYTCIIFLCM